MSCFGHWRHRWAKCGDSSRARWENQQLDCLICRRILTSLSASKCILNQRAARSRLKTRCGGGRTPRGARSVGLANAPAPTSDGQQARRHRACSSEQVWPLELLFRAPASQAFTVRSRNPSDSGRPQHVIPRPRVTEGSRRTFCHTTCVSAGFGRALRAPSGEQDCCRRVQAASCGGSMLVRPAPLHGGARAGARPFRG